MGMDVHTGLWVWACVQVQTCVQTCIADMCAEMCPDMCARACVGGDGQGLACEYKSCADSSLPEAFEHECLRHLQNMDAAQKAAIIFVGVRADRDVHARMFWTLQTHTALLAHGSQPHLPSTIQLWPIES